MASSPAGPLDPAAWSPNDRGKPPAPFYGAIRRLETMLAPGYTDRRRGERQRTSSWNEPLNRLRCSWTSSISSLLMGPSVAALGRPSGCLAFLRSSTATKLTPHLAQVTSTVQCASASLSSLTSQSASACEQARHL